MVAMKLRLLSCIVVVLVAVPLSAAKYEIKIVANQLETSSRKSKPLVKIVSQRVGDLIDIVSDEWHGGGITLKPKNGRWPKRLTVKLRTSDGTAYRSLASFVVSTDLDKVVARYSRQKLFAFLSRSSGSSNWVEIKKVRVSMRYETTHMSITVPQELLNTNPKFLKIAWIYMYSLQ